MKSRWFRNAILYQVDPSLFKDANGDGWGDLTGVTERLEHLRSMGATCVWLLPFYRSPFRDHGYDVSDHLSVDPRFGDMADFVLLLERADELGLRVLIELVVQHTSTDHPWFQQARADPESRYRDYYIWSDQPVKTDIEPIFPTVENDVWTWDEQAGQYYRHAFYSHEPDLDIANPAVREEIRRIMAFWLKLGISGFRVDAASHMIERAKVASTRDDGLWWLEELSGFVADRQPDAILMGESDVPAEEYRGYFGDGHRLHLLLDFWMNNHLFLALARGEAAPLARALEERPIPPHGCRYGVWLRNHDELDLERLEPAEREEVMRAFAPDPDMRIYGRGIRRRLAPMLGGDQARLAMSHAIVLSLPGTPILRYGEEIGMGEDLSLQERHSVRTPMQWSDADNGGFSAAPADRLAAPVVDDPGFGYRTVNVERQTADVHSLMEVTRRMAATRLGAREMTGTYRVARFDCPQVFGLRYDEKDGENLSVLTFANLSDRDVAFEIREDDLGDMVELLSDRDYPPPAGKPLSITIGPYGYRWLRRKERPLPPGEAAEARPFQNIQ